MPKIDKETLRGMSSLALAHIGDAVFELLARTYVCADGKRTAEKLHAATVAMVSATAQARAARRVEAILTQDEHAVFKRGRNSRVRAVPRGASVGEYHLATALEALFGYLYLCGETRRVEELFNAALPPQETQTDESRTDET
ncbi:MAG: ribonuclease III [Oscillospiraceae bacterium]|nr:ribonuclease III [Oscillospiraceae bacterium]